MQRRAFSCDPLDERPLASLLTLIDQDDGPRFGLGRSVVQMIQNSSACLFDDCHFICLLALFGLFCSKRLFACVDSAPRRYPIICLLAMLLLLFGAEWLACIAYIYHTSWCYLIYYFIPPHGVIMFFPPHGDSSRLTALPFYWHSHFARTRPFAAIALSAGAFSFCSRAAIRCHRAECWGIPILLAEATWHRTYSRIALRLFAAIAARPFWPFAYRAMLRLAWCEPNAHSLALLDNSPQANLHARRVRTRPSSSPELLWLPMPSQSQLNFQLGSKSISHTLPRTAVRHPSSSPLDTMLLLI